MRAFVLSCLLTVVMLASGSPAQSEEHLIGDRSNTQVIDGDSLQIGDKVVHLAGLDAPELGQVCLRHGRPWRCGLDAAYMLRKLVTLASSGSISCLPVDTVGSILVATCLDGAEDMSHVMLSGGHGVTIAEGDPLYEAASAQVYAATAEAARRASLGIWSSEFVPPAEWRRGRRLPVEDPSTACVVKGIVDVTGARLYYGPLDPGYATLDVSEAAGDRWFCSDDEARAAGWRRPGENVQKSSG